jgi:hypothetical protein
MSLPQAARRSGRKSQWPAGETVQTKTAWAVELLGPAAAAASAPLVGVCAGADAVATGVARVRQEDCCRDHPQRLGMEACRAWTKDPVRCTFQGPRVALTVLRLLRCRLEQSSGMGRWWSTPEG